MLKSKTLTKKENTITTLFKASFVLYKISSYVILVLVSLITFYICYKNEYFGLAEILYRLFLLNIILLIIALVFDISNKQQNKTNGS